MPHLNVDISEQAIKAAKVAAASAATPLRQWIERLILDATGTKTTESQEPVRERVNVPFEEL